MHWKGYKFIGSMKGRGGGGGAGQKWKWDLNWANVYSNGSKHDDAFYRWARIMREVHDANRSYSSQIKKPCAKHHGNGFSRMPLNCVSRSMSRDAKGRAKKHFWSLLNDGNEALAATIQPLMMRHIAKRAREVSESPARPVSSESRPSESFDSGVFVDLGSGLGGGENKPEPERENKRRPPVETGFSEPLSAYDIDPITLKKIMKTSQARDKTIVENNVQYKDLEEPANESVESVELVESVTPKANLDPAQASPESVRSAGTGTEVFCEPIDTIDHHPTKSANGTQSSSGVNTPSWADSSIPNHYLTIKAARASNGGSPSNSSNNGSNTTLSKTPISVPTSCVENPATSFDLTAEMRDNKTVPEVPSIDVDKAATDTHSPIPAPPASTISNRVDSVQLGDNENSKHVDEVQFPMGGPSASTSESADSTSSTNSANSASSDTNTSAFDGLKLKGKYRDRSGDLSKLLGSNLDDYEKLRRFDMGTTKKKFKLNPNIVGDPVEMDLLDYELCPHSKPVDSLDTEKMSLLEDVLKATRKDEIRTDEQLFRTKNVYLQNKDKNASLYERSFDKGNFFTGFTQAVSKDKKNAVRYQYVILDFCNNKLKCKSAPTLTLEGHPPDLPSFSMNSENPRLFSRQYAKLEHKGWVCVGCNDKGLVFQREIKTKSVPKKLALALFGTAGSALLVTIVMFADATFVVV